MQTGEGEYRGVAGFDGGTELGAHGGLVAYHVGPSAAKTGGANGLMAIHHDMVLGGFCYGIVVVVYDGLTVVVLAVGDNLAYIAAFHGIVAVFVHQLIGLLHPTLIVHCRG